MEEALPAAYAELKGICDKLEAHYRDMQDVEFTVQEGAPVHAADPLRQAHGGSALKIAVDMVQEGLIDRNTAIARVDPNALDQLLHPTLDPAAPRELIATGLAASPGAATGEVVFSADEAEKLAADGRRRHSGPNGNEPLKTFTACMPRRAFSPRAAA